jgi:L-ascorbate metabolism protein UlaG (beta-lactamase superfamily)
MRLTWLGHASVLLITKGKRVYVDPYAGNYVEKADVIIVTHGHSDHLSPEKIQAIRRSDTVVVSSASCAASITGQVLSMSAGDKKTLDGIEIEAVHSYNTKRFRSPGVPYHPKGQNIGVVLRMEDKTLFHASDTDFIVEMKNLPKMDLAMLPIGGTYTMDIPEAAEAAIALNPLMVLPMHRWDCDVTEFKDLVERKGGIKVLDMREGEEIEF